MTNQQFLLLISIECISTDDLTGSDELIGRFANFSAFDFTIGSFKANDKVNLDRQVALPVDFSTLQIIERDLTGDDLIDTIDLRQNMNAQRVVTLSNGAANYVLRFIVT
ncbi:hypothetical protein [Synechococcus sp. FACHB-909]|uniref:hypothetical protein n=1 Tax=Synechococcus sp. FACHB-909 TaxID=2692863 RepID=UPI0016842442|nr:hypothetical protein [Synechococcus sp. FACHB-909]MBD2719672.1 hypothetical protein [Synechococcus sp. FACHB-909]